MQMASVLGSRPQPARLRRSVWRFLFVLCGTMALSGCRDDAGEEVVTDAAAFGGVRLKVIIPDRYEIEDTLRLVVQDWMAETGAEVEIVTQSMAPDSPRPALENSLVLLPLTALPEWESSGKLAPFAGDPGARSVLNWDGMLLGPQSTLAARDQQWQAIPVALPTLKLYYRQDLLEAAGLDPPQTWDQYVALLKTRQQWADGLPVVEPWSAPFRPTMFLARAIAYARHPENFSLFFDVTDGRVLVDSPGFLEGLRTSVEILPLLSDEVRQLDPQQCRQLILAGQAAMAIACECGQQVTRLPYGPEMAAGTQDSETRRNLPSDRPFAIGISTLPGTGQVYNVSGEEWVTLKDGKVNRPVLGGFAGLVLAGGPSADELTASAMAHLAARLCVEKPAEAFPDGCYTMMRVDGQSDNSWMGADLKPAERQQCAEVTRQELDQQQLVAELLVLGRHRFRESLAEAVTEAIEGRTEPEAALKSLAAKWDEICEDIGREEVRKSYRRTVGLRLGR